MEYESYGDWYDNGPGSVNFSRQISEDRERYYREDPQDLNAFLEGLESTRQREMEETRLRKEDERQRAVEEIRSAVEGMKFQYNETKKDWEIIRDAAIEPLEDELFKI